jgi:hypothetical protein
MCNKKTIKAGVDSLNKLTTPNMVCAFDYVGKLGNNTVISRFTLELTKASTFLIREFRYNIPHAPFIVSVLNYKEIQSKSLADDKLEQLMTVKEIDGYTYIGEQSWKITRLFDSVFNKIRVPVIKSTFLDVNNLSDPTVQAVPEGIRVFIKVDEYGQLVTNEVNHINNKDVLKNNISNPWVDCFVNALKSHKDFRGCLIEAFLTGNRIYIVDAGFLVDTHLKETPWHERAEKIKLILSGFDLVKYGVEFIEPAALHAESQLESGLNIVKAKDGLFVLYSRSDSDQIFVVNRYTHLEPVSFLDGVLSCVGIENYKIKMDFSYPSTSFTPSLEEYYLVDNEDKSIVF